MTFSMGLLKKTFPVSDLVAVSFEDAPDSPEADEDEEPLERRNAENHDRQGHQ